MNKNVLMACAIVGATGMVGVARANTIEFRIVEATGQTQASPLDNVLDFAIQAKVSGAGLAVFGFDCLRLTGEGESTSTIQRLQTSNGDGTYYTGAPTVNNFPTMGGLARSYSYLAFIDAHFNGLINSSSGTFTNGPDNELGLIAGSVGGAQLMQTPGVDPGLSGQPAGIPFPLTQGSMPTTIMEEYFAQDHFIDVYRFRVTVTDFTLRFIPIDLVGADARSFTELGFNDEVWGPLVHAPGEDLILGSGLIEVIPGPSSVALLGMGGLALARRRRA